MVKTVIRFEDLYKAIDMMNRNVVMMARINPKLVSVSRTHSFRIRKDAKEILIKNDTKFTGELLQSIQVRKRKQSMRSLIYSISANSKHASWIEERIPTKQVVKVDRLIQQWYLVRGFKPPRLGTVKTFRMARHGYKGIHFLRDATNKNRSSIIKNSINAVRQYNTLIWKKKLI